MMRDFILTIGYICFLYIVIDYCIFSFFFFNDTATTEIYTLHIVGSVRCVQETGFYLNKRRSNRQKRNTGCNDYNYKYQTNNPQINTHLLQNQLFLNKIDIFIITQNCYFTNHTKLLI
eukprot:TRINITY_DN28691_c0_g1_i1.p2 TRINITY_DN28691_c0_g1~~TRINITY_DN28691_c0_g1_i1.p2  ORF type:complete len:118 (-),score=17.77 TRINITY_DN28691_c0_g1_i1:266-619(-)